MVSPVEASLTKDAEDRWLKPLGACTVQDLEVRHEIRKRAVPPTPEIYTMTFGPPGDNYHMLRFSPGKFDRYSCIYSFMNAEVDVRNAFFYPNIKRGDVVIDVGAAYGSYGLPAALLGARVHMFEIHPILCEELKTNIQLNYMESRCRVNELGLSDKAEKKEEWDECRDVSFIRFDDYVDLNKIEKLDYIKIDVEGMEVMVLDGARNALQKFKPKLQIECHVFYNHALLNKVTKFITEEISSDYKREIMPLNQDVMETFFSVHSK